MKETNRLIHTTSELKPGSFGGHPLPLPMNGSAQGCHPAAGCDITNLLTVERILGTLLGDGAVRVPTSEFWALFKIWRKTLANAGVRHHKGDDGWTVDVSYLTDSSLAKACEKAAFRHETADVVDEALDALTIVFGNDPAKLQLLRQFEV